MSYTFEANNLRPFVGGSESNMQDVFRSPRSTGNSSRQEGRFFQKLMPEDETEAKVEIPGDIKLLFEAQGERFSDFDSSVGGWERSEGEMTPSKNFKAKMTPKKSSSFKLAKSSGPRNLAAGPQRPIYSPRVTSTVSPSFSRNFPENFTPSNNNFGIRDKNAFLHPTFSNLCNTDEPLVFQKVSQTALKMAFHCNFVCPFCLQIVQQIDNPETTYAYTVNNYQKVYLAHAECYLNSKDNSIFSETTNPLENVPAQVSIDPSFSTSIVSVETLPDTKKAYFVKLEGFHPISSSKIFKIEKVCNQVCLTSDENQYLYINLETKSNMFFEQSSFTLPFNEFKLVATVYVTHSNDDAYVYELNVDLSDLRITSDTGKERQIELFSKQGGPLDLAVGLNVLQSASRSDFLQKVDNKLNYYHPSIQNSLTTLKYLAIPLPLKRAPVKEVQNTPQARNQLAKDMQLSFNSPNAKQSRLKVFKGQNEPDSRSEIPDLRNQEQDPPLIPPNLHINLNFNQSQGQNQNQNQNQGQNQVQHQAQHQVQQQNQSQGQNQNNQIRLPPGFMQNEKAINHHHKNVKMNAHYDSPGSRKNNNNNRNGGDTNTSSVSFNDNQSFTNAANPDDNSGKQMDDLEVDFRLEENLDKLPQLAKTYRGSKVLQDFIIKAGKTDIDRIIMRMSNAMMDLMLDPYANYMVQILAKHCSPEQRHLLLQKIAPGMYKIACDKKGTYALQTIVSLINTNAEDQLMKSALGPYVLELALDTQGNHVIQKLINTVSLKNIEFIYQPLIENFYHVATHASGSLVFKQLIIKVEKLTNMKTTIIHTVCHEMENLVQDPYGNYVIQYALEYYPKDCLVIQQKIVSKLIPYSSQKFSSNIIEKSLAVGDYSFRKKVATEILKNERLSDLLKNKYGNYVILHTLAICDNDDKQSIMEGIYRGVHSFQGTKYKSRWNKFLEENPLNITWNPNASPSNRSPMGKNGGQSFEDAFSESNEHKIPKLPSKEEDLKKLEVVKKIWRDMNKEEKNPTPSNSTRGHNRNYSGFDDYCDSNNASPTHMMNEQSGNYYQQEPFNFYLNTTKTDDYNKQQKWY